MIIVHDQQTGNEVHGYAIDITEFQFTLVDVRGDKIGIFDISLLNHSNKKNE